MFIKYLAAALAVVLVFSYLGPIAWKLKEVSLAAVMLVGVVMMLIDLRESLQNPDA